MKRASQHPDRVIPDPHVAYRDAVRTSPWNAANDLPQRGDWSTFRYAVKDIILGVATHRYDRGRRCLEVRAYFTGEHPAYEDFEPTRILFLILAAQAWQSGRRMELHFEGGVPWDLRRYLELRLGSRLSGHEETLSHDLASKLLVDLTDLPEPLVQSLGDGLASEHVCFHVQRGTWSARQVRVLWRRGVPLHWVFRERPDAVRSPIAATYLLRHLTAAILEERAIGRITGREEGSRIGADVISDSDDRWLELVQSVTLRGPDSLTRVSLEAGARFVLVPVLAATAANCAEAMRRAVTIFPGHRLIFAFPLDVLAFSESQQADLSRALKTVGAEAVAVGETVHQLRTEAELHLAITAMQADETELEAALDARYAE